MADAGTARVPPALLNDRLFEALPVAPIWASTALALILIALFLGSLTATGELQAFLADQDIRWWQIREGRMAILLALMAAYLPAARRYATLAIRRNVEGLRGRLGWPSEADARAAASPNAAAMRRWAAVSVLALPIVATLVDRDPTLYFQAAYWGAANLWTWALGTFVCWNGGALFSALLIAAGRFRALGRRIPRVDLLDLSPLSPFARQGLQSALPLVILLAFWAFNAIDQGFVWALGVMVPFTLGLATAGMLLPVRGVRDRVREAKREEIARVDRALRGEAEALAGSSIAARAAGASVADLLAWRAFVDDVREWPFDTPSRVRFALYLAIPLGSWLGGAFVERLLDALLR
jgi:hypothetical protein